MEWVGHPPNGRVSLSPEAGNPPGARLAQADGSASEHGRFTGDGLRDERSIPMPTTVRWSFAAVLAS
jgi:hypothetical protein